MNRRRRLRTLFPRPRRQLAAGLLLASYLVAILGLPIPHLLSASPATTQPLCESPRCCCASAETCRQQCCCAPVRSEDSPDTVDQAVAPSAGDPDDARVVWRSVLQSRTCGGFASWWVGLLTPGVPPTNLSWTCEIVAVGWLVTDCSYPEALSHPPTIPPPRV